MTDKAPIIFDIFKQIKVEVDEIWSQLDRLINISNALEILQPSCRVYLAGSGLITSGVDTSVPFDFDRWDDGDIHDTINLRRIYVGKYPGKWIVGASFLWDTAVGGFRRIRIRRTNLGTGAAAFVAIDQKTAAGFTGHCIETVIRAVDGDYVEVLCFQDSGGNLNMLNSQEQTEFWAYRLGD